MDSLYCMKFKPFNSESPWEDLPVLDFFLVYPEDPSNIEFLVKQKATKLGLSGGHFGVYNTGVKLEAGRKFKIIKSQLNVICYLAKLDPNQTVLT